jgi:drug/metabolite transporter (DMT)-like permease
MSRRRATLAGLVAVALWSALALLTVATAPVPPFLLNALCFGIGGALGLALIVAGRGFGVLRGVPWWAHGFAAAGLFGYHALYFTAFRLAAGAGAEAATGLVAYLWPLLIVLFSGLLPGERLRPGHLAGAGLAFAGAALIVLRGGFALQGGAGAALALAFLCALTWAGYSVLSRRLAQVPTESVAVACLITAMLSALAHLALEETAWPATATGWAAVTALGLGPVGAAFVVWDIGMKQGDIQLLGVASYAAPLLSTLALVAAGIAAPAPVLALSAAMIAAGAALAARAGRSVRRD